MATCFDRWEKDPFFPAAEEVQESADRMESVYRRWMHERKDSSIPKTGADDVSSELLRDLQTALGTAKWQLEELARAVKSNDEVYSAGEDTRARHSQFVQAIGSQVEMVENSLKESNQEKGENIHAWSGWTKEKEKETSLHFFYLAPYRQYLERKGSPMSREWHIQIRRRRRLTGTGGQQALVPILRLGRFHSPLMIDCLIFPLRRLRAFLA